MTGLIEQIQRDAANRDIPVDATLRRVKLAAAKLNLGMLENWVTDELSGYRGEVPDYRKLQGQPAAWNPYNGWVPIHSDNECFMDIISSVPVPQSIGSLIDTLNISEGGMLDFPLPLGLVSELNKYMNFQTTRAVVKLGRGQAVSIVDRVRDLILDWSIKMEAQGIVGDGLSFTTEEKTQAKRSMTTIHIGSIENFAGNLGADQVAGDVTLTPEAKTDLLALANELETSFDHLVAMGANERHFRVALDVFKAETIVDSPSNSKIKSLLEDIRSALAGATGNLLAEGAKSMIGTALRSFG